MKFDLVDFQRQLRAEISRLRKILDATMAKPMEVKFKAILPDYKRRGLTKGVKLGPRKDSIQVRAVNWIRDYLVNGKPHYSSRVLADAGKAGFKIATFQIASRRVPGLMKTATGPSKRGTWQLGR